MVVERSRVASSFTQVKGALIDETYAVLSAWDFSVPKKSNLDRLRENELHRCEEPDLASRCREGVQSAVRCGRRGRPLAVLARGGCSLDEWKPILLWHITRDEFLLRDFLQNWLFPAHESGTYRIRPEHLYEHLRTVDARGGITEHEWSDATLNRVAVGFSRLPSTSASCGAQASRSSPPTTFQSAASRTSFMRCAIPEQVPVA